VSVLDYIAALRSKDVWIEAAIGIGIGTVAGIGIKAIAKKLSANMVLFLGTIMSLWSLYQSINLSIDMINGGVSREQVARYLAVLTATVILTTLIGKVCFTEDTLIKTDDGYKEIKDIEVGDLVYSEDPLTGEKGLKKVTNVFVNETSVIVRVFVEDEEIETTPTHPFWVIGKGWVAAGDMEVGDKVYLYSCDSREIKELKFEHLDSPIKVYNFEVEDWHTYFVSEHDVFVHNSCGGKGKALSPSEASEKITSAERTGSGLKSDVYHRSASYLSEGQLSQGTTFSITGDDGVDRTLLQVSGELNGKTGIFEYIIGSDGIVTHQIFKPGGIINGVPN
jgi:hypothetical protein